MGIEESRYKLVRASQDDKYYHPGRTAYIMIGKEVVGVVGNIHPLMEKKYNVKDVYIVELNLTTLLNLKTSKVKFTEIPMYPSVSRDYCFGDGSGYSYFLIFVVRLFKRANS